MTLYLKLIFFIGSEATTLYLRSLFLIVSEVSDFILKSVFLVESEAKCVHITLSFFTSFSKINYWLLQILQDQEYLLITHI